jgi:hypothetical protein
LRITLGTAISKSSCVTWTRRSLRANMPVKNCFFLRVKESEFFFSTSLDLFWRGKKNRKERREISHPLPCRPL